MQVILPEYRCKEIIDNMSVTEGRYQEQRASYDDKMEILRLLSISHPKRKHKIPKEPIAPQHSYTAVAYARECMEKVHHVHKTIVLPTGESFWQKL